MGTENPIFYSLNHLRKRYQNMALQGKILLFYMEELSVSEIASVLTIPSGTVKSRLYQARKILKKELEVILDEKNK